MRAVICSMAIALAVGEFSQLRLVGHPLASILPEPVGAQLGIDRSGCIWRRNGATWVKIQCLGPDKMKLFKR